MRKFKNEGEKKSIAKEKINIASWMVETVSKKKQKQSTVQKSQAVKNRLLN